MKILVIGGGLSGLSCAITLAENGHNITLLEGSPKLGGKAYSFYSEKLDLEIDNGQHLLLGCYQSTLKYLTKINSVHNLDFIDGINIPFLTKKNGIFYLKNSSNLYPFNLFFGFLFFNYLNVKEKIKIAFLFFDIMFAKHDTDKNAYDYLIEKKQKELLTKFWEPILVSIFNCDLTEINAKSLIIILKQVFLINSKSFKFLVPKVSLKKLLIDNAKEFLIKHNTQINLSERVIDTKIKDNKVVEILTNKQIYNDFDYVIFAIPTYALNRLFNLEILQNIKYNPIISVFFKIKNGKLKDRYYTLPGSFIQWIFIRDDLVCITTSNPKNLIDLSENELKELYKKEFLEYFTQFKEEEISNIVIIKEKKATFVLDNFVQKLRSNRVLEYHNVIIAGDWYNTNLPSTIESAILSGEKAARQILNRHKTN